MGLGVYIPYIVIVLNQLLKVNGNCATGTQILENNTVIQIPETDIGLLYPIIPVEEETWSYLVKNFNTEVPTVPQARLIRGFFEFNVTKNESLSISLRKALDKEVLIEYLGIDVDSIVLTVTCSDVSSVIDVDLRVGIKPVNEFYPEFQHPPFVVTIPENTKIGTSVFDLSQHVKDGDVPQDLPFYFFIVDFSSADIDGKDLFEIGSIQQGIITVSGNIDFDDMHNNHPPTYRKLNVTVEDNGNKMRVAVLSVYINDTDDLPPAFNFPECKLRSCDSAIYKSYTHSSYRGPLTTDKQIKATDQDTLNYQVIYSIVAVSDSAGSFTINSSTGQVSQIGDVYQTVTIQIKAEENSINKHSALASLLVYAGNDTIIISNTPSGGGNVGASRVENSDSDMKTVLIIVAVLAVIIIAVLAVIFIVYYKKQNKAISPEDQGTSETSTDTEEIQSESNKSMQWPPVKSDSKQDLLATTTDVANLPTPDGKGNRLPPITLKDSSTETETEVKRKRSRRRNKNKEPEIYDGTREYDMEADTEFFDSSDKSKIKRSTRSKDTKTDPKYWIKVQNDF